MALLVGERCSSVGRSVASTAGRFSCGQQTGDLLRRSCPLLRGSQVRWTEPQSSISGCSDQRREFIAAQPPPGRALKAPRSKFNSGLWHSALTTEEVGAIGRLLAQLIEGARGRHSLIERAEGNKLGLAQGDRDSGFLGRSTALESCGASSMYRPPMMMMPATGGRASQLTR